MRSLCLFLLVVVLAVTCGGADAQYVVRRVPYVAPRPMPRPMMVPRVYYPPSPPMGYNYGIGQTAGITPYYCGGGRCWYYRSR